MIHLIVIMHFIVISVGVITLLMTYNQFKAHEEKVLQWLFYTDLFFTISMALDAVRIYIAKNVFTISNEFWSVYYPILDLSSIATFLAAASMIVFSIGKRRTKAFKSMFAMVFLFPAAIRVAEAVQYCNYPYLGSISYIIMLACCTGFGFASIYQMPMAYRSITVTYTAALAVYLPVYIATNLVSGIPSWIFKIPYTQIIYFVLNILGIVYLKGKAEGRGEPGQKRHFQPTGLEDIRIWGEKYGLTSRESEIILAMIEGKNNTEIGEALFISPNTVKNHIYNIYKKVGIKNRFELISTMTREP